MIRIVALALVLAACGSGTDSGSTTSGFDSGEVVLRIATAGGLVPREVALSEVPEVTLMGDGRLIIVPEGQEFGAPFPVIVEYQLTPSGLDQILEAAAAAGLESPLTDYGFAGVTDLPNTDFTLSTASGAQMASVYALGFDDADGFGVTADQSEARRALTGFRAKVLDAESWLGADAEGPQPFRPQAVAVFVTGVVDDPPEGAAVEVWPLGDLGAVQGDGTAPFPCTLVEGDDINVLYAGVEASTYGTLWSSGESLHYVALQPLLPDAESCPG